MDTTIFILDDKPTDGFVAEKLIKLTYNGSQVSTFTNPQQALEQLQVLFNDDLSYFHSNYFLISTCQLWRLLIQIFELRNQKDFQDKLLQEQISQDGHTLRKENDLYQKGNLLQNGDCKINCVR
jgi:hypothetical protein